MTESEPQWPPDRARGEWTNAKAKTPKLTVRSKAILALGLLVFALGVYLVGQDVKRHDLDAAFAQQQKVLQEREHKIEALRAELAELRQKIQNTSEMDALKARLEESQRNLAAAQRKLASSTKELERLSSNRAAAVRPATRSADTAEKQPAPVRATTGNQPRTYEAVRSTAVHEEPMSSSRVVARLTKGTQVTVVGSENGWLEIRSKHGKPPGYVRADDAMFISRAN
jgi:septal ring factor EnvC (AmiA/AmiB activator)